jgi:ABC-type antimicrobial peptide transport system ATPase subunit
MFIESVIVHFEVYNPLRVTLKLSNIALECVHEENSGTDGITSSQYNSFELKKPMDDPNTVSSMITLEYFQLENIWEVNLQPRERRKVTLFMMNMIFFSLLTCTHVCYYYYYYS